jgi:hypothetical protein
MAQAGTDKKPTVVFLARFFSEGSDRRRPLRGNGLQREKSPKTGKTQKKVQNNFRGTPVFLQNGPDFRPRTGLEKAHHLQGADFQHLPRIELRGFFAFRPPSGRPVSPPTAFAGPLPRTLFVNLWQ